MLKIAAFLVVKNDAFYVDMALKSVLPYVVGVYVQDQMSTDGTWDVLREFQEVVQDVGIGRGLVVSERIDTGNADRFSQDYDEPHYRTMAVQRCEEIFKPDWILKLDADEIYTPLFFERLDFIDKTDHPEFNAVRVAGDRFISTTHRSVHPTAMEVSPAGIPFVDPHTQLWRAGMGVKYVSNPAFQRFHPILDPDPQPQLWLPGICNVHLHRTFGPKSVAFWQEGGEELTKPIYPPTSCPRWFNSAVNMGNSEEVAFEWPQYVLDKWAAWEGGVW